MPTEDAETTESPVTPPEQPPKAKPSKADEPKAERKLTKAEKDAGAVRLSGTGIPLDKDSHPIGLKKRGE